MVCNNCGSYADENLSICPVCGKALTPDNPVLTADQMTERPDFLDIGEPIKLNNIKIPEDNSKSLKKAGIICGILVIVAITGILLAKFIPKFSSYNEAEELLKEGKIEEAVEIYSELSDFRDSNEKARGGAYYEYAEDLFESGDYQNASTYFMKAATYAYEDSESRFKESRYIYGERCLEEQRFDEAAAAFASVGEYEDAAEKELECYYKKAESCMEAGDYDNAAKFYLEAGGYGDAAEKRLECYYKKAENCMEAGDYTGAYDNYIKSEYNDYMDKANECLLVYADSSYAAGKYNLALSNYEKIDSTYKDVTDKKDNCYIALAKEAEASGTYPSAVEYYKEVSRKDVSREINKNKMAYIDEHFDSRDRLTMEYLCDMKYDTANTGYKEEALAKYHDLSGWSVNSYINKAEDDYETRDSYASASYTTYVHTYFVNDEEYEMDLYGYVVYSNNTTGATIDFDKIKSGSTISISIDTGEDLTGEAVLYIFEAGQDKLFEKYTFNIR